MLKKHSLISNNLISTVILTLKIIYYLKLKKKSIQKKKYYV